MDLDIGKHCELSNCNRLDFCPFHCRDCNKWFCLEHKDKKDHNCPIKEYNKTVDKDFVPKKPKKHRCKICRADIPHYVVDAYRCKKCNMKLCGNHRLPEGHNCNFLEEIIEEKKKLKNTIAEPKAFSIWNFCKKN